MKPLWIPVVALALGTILLARQHSYTDAEISAGARLFETSCGSCHGENGDKVVGIDFSKGRFKTAKTDEDLVRIIRNGVPNTGMPPNPFNETQAGNLVAFVRSMVGGPRNGNLAAANLAGDAVRGKAIYEGKGTCTTCHPVSGVGARATLQQLERAIVDPSAEIAPQYRVYQVISKGNVTTRGTLLNQDTFSIQLRDSSDKLVSFWKSDLKEFGFQPSPMPSFKAKLTVQEIADVVRYLVSLRQ